MLTGKAEALGYPFEIAWQRVGSPAREYIIFHLTFLHMRESLRQDFWSLNFVGGNDDR